MKKTINLSKSMVFCFLFALMATFMFAGTTGEAAKKPTCAKKQTVYVKRFLDCDDDGDEYYYGIMTNYSGFIYVKNMSSKAKITNIKSSNSKFKASDAKIYSTIKGVVIETKKDFASVKNGEKTKITFTVKQNGRSYKLSCNVTFKYRPTPLKSLKINGKEYASKFNKGITEFDTTDFVKTSKLKISYKAASGYKVTEIRAFYDDVKNDIYTSKTVKNNSTISAKNLSEIQVTYKVTKKPANYQKSGNFRTNKIESPLHETLSIYSIDY